MDFTFATIAIISVMIFVLAGMVGFVYWRQTLLLQQVDTLAGALAGLMAKYKFDHTRAPADVEVTTTEAPPPTADAEEAHAEPESDDRLSVVEEAIEKVTGPPASATAAHAHTEAEIDVDSLLTKTAPQLRQMLNDRGIPYGKRDSKGVLIELLKAVS